MSDETAQEKPLRVLHIGKYFPPHRGGMETVLRDQMNMQARDEGLRVAAVVHSSERRYTDAVEVTEQGYRVRRSARWFTTVFAPMSPFFWLSVMKEIRELEPDDIKIHMPNLSAFWLLLLPSARKRRWVILWHSDVLPSRHSFGLRCFYWLYKPFEWLLLKRADQIIATSPPYLEASKPLAEFRHKCIVEPLKLDKDRIPAKFFSARQPAKEPGEGVRVLCVGRLTYYKSFDTAIKAIARIPNAQLRIVGDGELRETLVTLVHVLELEERVTLLGEVEDELLWQQYIWCDVNCLPSCERTEAFGLSVTEAALFKRSSLVSQVAGSGLVWNAADTGLPYETAEPLKVDSLVCAINKLFLSLSKIN